MNRNTHIAVVVWVNICRFLLAAVFIFSGFVKANDPLGTVYKSQDYLEAWGIMDFMPAVVPYLGAMGMGVFEFALGFYLFFGIHRRVAPTLVLLVMSLMTPLTLWLAIANPISDCGCFGDAVVLSNWETFAKNVVLLIAAISLYKWRKTLIVKLVSTKVDWLVALYGVVFIIFYTIFCIRHLPVFDFRPYHIGADIRKGMEIPEGEKMTTYETTFIYAKEGVEKEFTVDALPTDTTWVFVDSHTRIKEKGYEPPIHDFAIQSQEDGENLTDVVLNDSSYTFLLVAPYLAQADDSGMDLINEVYDYCIDNGYRFLCLTASSDKEIAAWQDATGAEYPFALMDDITLKTMIRSNPGLMLLKKGVVLNKWSSDNLPDEYLLNAPLEKLPLGQLNMKSVLHKLLEVIGWFIGPLLALTVIDLLWLRWHKAKEKSRKEKEQKKEQAKEQEKDETL